MVFLDRGGFIGTAVLLSHLGFAWGFAGGPKIELALEVDRDGPEEAAELCNWGEDGVVLVVTSDSLLAP